MKSFAQWWNPRKTWLWAGLGVVALGGIGLITAVSEQISTQLDYNGNVGELVDGVLVGQTFVAGVPDLSGIAVRFATYSGRDNTQPVRFGLRPWPIPGEESANEDIRQASIEAKALGDNQFHHFRFKPIPDSAGKTYFFYLTSTGSKAGDAVTVDRDTSDPYPAGSAFIARNFSQAQALKDIERAGKPQLDLSFTTYHQVPLWTATKHFLSQSVGAFTTTWQERRLEYANWLQAVLVAGLFVAVWWGLFIRPLASWQPTSSTVRRLLGLLAIIGLGLRVWYAMTLPVTNDEGNYLYDGVTLLRGHLAGGDGYVKALLPVVWVSIWQGLFGHTSVLIGRLASIVAGILTLYPLYFLGAFLKDKKTGLVAAAAWALFGAPIVFSIYVHTQPFALFVGTAGLALLLWAMSNPARFWLMGLFWGGWLLGLGVASRKSILALGLPVIVALLLKTIDWRAGVRAALVIGSGFLLALSLLVIIAYGMYGQEGIYEAIGINSADDGITSVEESQEEQVRAYSIRGMTPFFRESLPLIFLTVIAIGTIFETILAGWRLPAWLIGWLAAGYVFSWAWNFFAEHERGDYMVGGMSWLWHAMALMIGLMAVWQRLPGEGGLLVKRPSSRQAMLPLLLPASWIAGLIFFYSNWIKFHVNYVAEFLPPLTLLAAVGAAFVSYTLNRATTRRGRIFSRAVMTFFILILGWAIVLSNYVTFVFPHTGTFKQSAIEEAAAWASANIPHDQVIFTGAAIIPYASGHRISLDIAHPRWYAYEFTRINTGRLTTFLPSASDMRSAFRQAQWFLLDQQTAFSFLMEYDDIKQAVERDFVQVKGIENGSNTLTFYKRVRSTPP